MAGIIPNTALVNNFDANAQIMSGALLRIYQPGTITPVTAYKDSGLTAGNEHPWPIEADAAGRIPAFWIADGSYRVRLSSADGGYVAYDVPIIATVGASTNSGNAGSGVSSEVIFQTGDVLWLPIATTRSGWVRHNGRTIGSASSGATERANSDVADIYDFLWENYDDTTCPVTGGRGASSSADFAANKPMATLDLRFVSPIGMDTMGNTAAGLSTGVPTIRGAANAAASILGEAKHTLTAAESAELTYTLTLTDPHHSHATVNPASGSTYASSAADGVGDGSGGSDGPARDLTTMQTSAEATGITVTLSDNAGGGAHNNTPRVMTGTYYAKL